MVGSNNYPKNTKEKKLENLNCVGTSWKNDGEIEVSLLTIWTKKWNMKT